MSAKKRKRTGRPGKKPEPVTVTNTTHQPKTLMRKIFEREQQDNPRRRNRILQFWPPSLDGCLSFLIIDPTLLKLPLRSLHVLRAHCSSERASFSTPLDRRVVKAATAAEALSDPR
jgi:hypothetical protein